MELRSVLVAVLAVMSAQCLCARSYTWIGGTSGAWGTAANWVADDDPDVHVVPSGSQDSVTLACEEGDITITCSGWLEPAIVFATNVTFFVESGTATLKGSQSGTGNLTKTGSGLLRVQGGSSRTGWAYVYGGTLVLANERILGQRGGCIVGDGINEAILQVERDYTWGARLFGPNDGSGDLTIKNKGVLIWDVSNNNKTVGQITNLNLEEGGLIRLGSHSLATDSSVAVFTVAGDFQFLSASDPTVNGTLRLRSSELRITGTRNKTLVLSCGIDAQFQYPNYTAYAKLGAAGGNGLEVDVHVLGVVKDMWDGRDGIDIINSGTVKLSGNNTYGGNVNGNQGNTRVQSGRLLVDNTVGSGTGYSKVVVSAGATLGGVGTIGGLTENKTYSNRGGNGYTNDACVVVKGAAGNPGVLAPGSYEDTTNARIYGTLTVGSAATPSSVTMNSNTKLAVSVGKGGATALKVYGPLTLGSNVTLDVNVSKDAKAGEHVLVSATDGITGDYVLTGNVKSSRLIRTANEIRVRVSKGLILFAH